MLNGPHLSLSRAGGEAGKAVTLIADQPTPEKYKRDEAVGSPAMRVMPSNFELGSSLAGTGARGKRHRQAAGRVITLARCPEDAVRPSKSLRP